MVETTRVSALARRARGLVQDLKLLSLDDNITPVGRMELAVEVLQVGFNYFSGDTELVCDLLVTQPFLQEQDIQIDVI